MSRCFDLRNLDTSTISDQQAGDLEIETTQEVYAAIQEYRRTRQNQLVEEELFYDAPVYQPGIYRYDMEQDLSRLVDIQDQMQTVAKIQRIMRENAVRDMNDWYTRFNTWLRKSSENRKNARVWTIYKKGLAERKAKVYRVTKSTEYQQLREEWSKLLKVSQKLIGNKDWLWEHYFSLRDDEIGPYFAGWDPEEFDDQQVLKQGQGEVADVLGDMHVVEQSAYNAEGRWNTDGLWGFWLQSSLIDTMKKDWAKRHAFYEGSQI